MPLLAKWPYLALLVFGILVGFGLARNEVTQGGGQRLLQQWPYVLAGLIGGLVGLGELVARYRDAPAKALKTIGAALYISLNVAASIAALVLIRLFGWTFGAAGTSLLVTQVVIAGFGAMVLFRSSLFIFRVGNEDVAVGPAGFLQIVLSAADGEVDRRRAQSRSRDVNLAMRQVSYKKAAVGLFAFCSALMQNLPPQRQHEVGEQVNKLSARTDVDDQVKSLLLGLLLMNEVGPEVLRSAVTTLGDRIKVPDDTSSATRDAAQSRERKPSDLPIEVPKTSVAAEVPPLAQTVTRRNGTESPTGEESIGIIPNRRSELLTRPELLEALTLAINRATLAPGLPEGYQIDSTQNSDPDRARDLVRQIDLPRRVLLASVAQPLRDVAWLLNGMLQANNLDLRLEYWVPDDVLVDFRTRRVDGTVPDIVVGDNQLAKALAEQFGEHFDGTLVRF